MANQIALNDLHGHYLAQKTAIDAAVARVLDSGWYILGREVAAFEEEFADFCGAAGAVAVNSGTDALQLALWALGVGPGDEVITVAHTAVATAAAVRLVGAAPVFVDIDPVTYTLDPARLAGAITSHTKAIVPVHIYGHPAEMDAIMQVADAAGIPVVEDCAQAHGASYRGQPVGTMGSAGCFSFYPTKNLGALGDGGAVISRDPLLLDEVRLRREYGWTPQARYISQVSGMNSRLDEMQAAILRVRLRALHADNQVRRALAAEYAALLPDAVTPPVERPDCRHVYHLYVVRMPERDRVRGALAEQGIGAGIHYPAPIHRQPAYLDMVRPDTQVPVTEQAAQEILSLPMHPLLARQQVAQVASALHELLS